MTDETTPAAAIEVVLDELRTFPPPESFKKDALVVDTHLYDEANRDFEGFLGPPGGRAPHLAA